MSRHSTTLRPDIRFRHVYVDVQCARCLDGIAAARLMILPGADHMFTLGDHAATADATLASVKKASRRDGRRLLTTVLMTDIVDRPGPQYDPPTPHRPAARALIGQAGTPTLDPAKGSES